MTKEAYSPIGADRVYLDDLTWKNDVLLFIIAGVISSITIPLMCLKSNKNAFQLLGILK